MGAGGQRPKPKNEHIRVFLRMRPFDKSESEKDAQDAKSKMHQKWVITDEQNIAMQTTSVKQTRILKRERSPNAPSKQSLTASLNSHKFTKHGDRKEDYEESVVQTMGKANAFSKWKGLNILTGFRFYSEMLRHGSGQRGSLPGFHKRYYPEFPERHQRNNLHVWTDRSWQDLHDAW